MGYRIARRDGMGWVNGEGAWGKVHESREGTRETQWGWQRQRKVGKGRMNGIFYMEWLVRIIIL